MWNFIKNIFRRKPKKEVQEGISLERNIEINTVAGERFFKLKNDDCGLVLHSNGEIEVLFTKQDPNNKTFSDTEESLMALAVFIKQEGFLAMINDEFRKIASAAEKNK